MSATGSSLPGRDGTNSPTSAWARARTSRWPRRRARRSCGWVASSTGGRVRGHMALSDLWNSTLVYFGVREEDWEDEYDDDGSAAHEDLEQVYSERPNVRRLSPRRRPGSDFDDICAEEEPRGGGPVPIRGGRNGGPVPQNGHRTAGQVSLVVPKSFHDAQKVADKLKSDVPVIINFQSADPELAKRLVDFASGLTYALDGSMQRVADRVFLLTPSSISVSAEDKALLMERGFFNQY